MTLPASPLVGRDSELAEFASAMDRATGGHGGALVWSGSGGVGKSRLLRAGAELGRQRGWTVVVGRCYPVDAGVPYAPWADALVPALRALEPGTLATLSRGGAAELARLLPGLDAAGTAERPADSAAEEKARLHWTLAQFLARWAERAPLLLALDDVQWMDPSSAELFHLLARQAPESKLLVTCTHNTEERFRGGAWRAVERSLAAAGLIARHPVGPLTLAETERLVADRFGTPPEVTRPFVALLWGWTRGNPFFVEETLKALVGSGRLFRQDRHWLGWETEQLELPASVREAALARLERLSPAAGRLAGTAAAYGAPVPLALLERLDSAQDDGGDVVDALDELRTGGVLLERAGRDDVLYEFAHPILREAVYADLGGARSRRLHAAIAEALEAEALEAEALEADAGRGELRAGELAYHYTRSGDRSLAPKAVRYLADAGRDALRLGANAEALAYLESAVRKQRESTATGPEPDAALAEDLGRAHARVGQLDEALAIWEAAREEAEGAGDWRRAAALRRRMGLACFAGAKHDAALAHLEAGTDAAERAADEPLLAELRLSLGTALQELGRARDAHAQIASALALATALRDARLLARCHRALVLLHLWTGNPALAREHGSRAVELAEQSGDPGTACATHWALAALATMAGDSERTQAHLAECTRLADEMRSPLWRLWADEIAIEHAAATGDWDAALSRAERALALARGLGQRTLLPRLLVWAGMLYLARGDRERGREYTREAWTLSGSDQAPGGALDLHAAVPAHTGVAADHLAAGEFPEAIMVAEAGIALADRSGYVAWAMHRLLPVLGEAALYAEDLARAERTAERLRRDAARLEHRIGLAWADACHALVLRLGGERDRPVMLLRDAVERLEAVGFVPDAARLRRWLAKALAEVGERDAAVHELRAAHDVFARLGAVPELEAAREQLRELGSRPPQRMVGTGAAGLSERELEIVRLAAAGRSNKAIARALEISPRTVSTHLSNAFRKLELGSRRDLAEVARRLDLLGG